MKYFTIYLSAVSIDEFLSETLIKKLVEMHRLCKLNGYTTLIRQKEDIYETEKVSNAYYFT